MSSPLATDPVSKPGDSLAEGMKTARAGEFKAQSGAADIAADDVGVSAASEGVEKAKKDPNT